MSALELTPEGQLRVMPLSVIQELIHERNTLREERDEAREALRDCVWWAESVSRRVTVDRESINWTGLQQARKALADIQKEEKFAEDLERECNQRKADWNKACDEQGWLMLECDGRRAKAAKLREALQSVMDWNPKPEYWERPEAVARFEADMARARKVLEETE